MLHLLIPLARVFLGDWPQSEEGKLGRIPDNRVTTILRSLPSALLPLKPRRNTDYNMKEGMGGDGITRCWKSDSIPRHCISSSPSSSYPLSFSSTPFLHSIEAILSLFSNSRSFLTANLSIAYSGLWDSNCTNMFLGLHATCSFSTNETGFEYPFLVLFLKKKTCKIGSRCVGMSVCVCVCVCVSLCVCVCVCVSV